MHRTGRTRRPWKLGALGLTAAALLSATACGPADDAAAPPASTTPPTTAPSTAPTTAPTTASPSSRPGDSGSTDGGPSATAGEPPGTTGETDWEPKDGICQDLNTEVKVDWALPPVKDDSRLELVITNTSTRPCKLYQYPAVKFGDDQRFLPPVKSSKPQNPIVLAPGKEAYAGLLARVGNKEVSPLEKELIIAPAGRNEPKDTGEGALLEVPEPGVHVDVRTARVSYWRPDSESAQSALYPQ
ncbi:DUF4232 domain-containing protein [Streptomyces sp. NPDC001930]|uniref:DUF4232 domain-containing protein n=1 Tax=Streptomyces sp. NPDC001930 TaxID=3364625 RepID=UPI0036B68CD3